MRGSQARSRPSSCLADYCLAGKRQVTAGVHRECRKGPPPGCVLATGPQVQVLGAAKHSGSSGGICGPSPWEPLGPSLPVTPSASWAPALWSPGDGMAMGPGRGQPATGGGALLAAGSPGVGAGAGGRGRCLNPSPGSRSCPSPPPPREASRAAAPTEPPRGAGAAAPGRGLCAHSRPSWAPATRGTLSTEQDPLSQHEHKAGVHGAYPRAPPCPLPPTPDPFPGDPLTASNRPLQRRPGQAPCRPPTCLPCGCSGLPRPLGGAFVTQPLPGDPVLTPRWREGTGKTQELSVPGSLPSPLSNLPAPARLLGVPQGAPHFPLPRGPAQAASPG